jgi:hypothetical protein
MERQISLIRPRLAGRVIAEMVALGSASLCAGVYAADVTTPPAPCHPNPHARADAETVEHRGGMSVIA